MKARILKAVLAPRFLPYLAAVNLAVFTLSVAIPDDPHPFLDEWGPVSLLSGFQLLTCGLLALEIHKIRGAWLWKLIGWGFFFLCADEMLQLHESADRLIHWLAGIEENSFTDRLDDVFVGLYGLAGLCALIAGRSEFAVFLRQWWIFAAGFVCFAATVAFDVVLTDFRVLQAYIDIPAPSSGLWLEVAEEGFKIAGGFCFVAAVRKCWEGLHARPSHPRPTARTVPA